MKSFKRRSSHLRLVARDLPYTHSYESQLLTHIDPKDPCRTGRGFLELVTIRCCLSSAASYDGCDSRGLIDWMFATLIREGQVM